MANRLQNLQLLVLACAIPCAWVAVQGGTVNYAVIVKAVENNKQVVIKWLWVFLSVHTCCLLLSLTRILLLIADIESANTIVTIVYNMAASIALPRLLHDSFYNAESPNSFVEELACGFITGFYLYKIIFLPDAARGAKIFKLLYYLPALLVTTNILSTSKGANVLLAFAFLLSSSSTIFELSALSRSHFNHNLVHKTTIGLASLFLIQNMLTMFLLVYKLWGEWFDYYRRLELAYLLTIFTSAIVASIFIGGWTTSGKNSLKCQNPSPKRLDSEEKRIKSLTVK